MKRLTSLVGIVAALFLSVTPNFAFATVCGSLTTLNGLKDAQNAVNGAAVRITMTQDCTLTGLELNMDRIGSPAARPLYLYSNVAGLPGALLDTGTNISPSATYPTLAYETSNLSGGVCGASGSSYWIVILQAGDDGSNRILFSTNYGAADTSTAAYLQSGTWNTSFDPSGGVGVIDGTPTTCASAGGAQPFSRFIAFWW